LAKAYSERRWQKILEKVIFADEDPSKQRHGTSQGRLEFLGWGVARTVEVIDRFVIRPELEAIEDEIFGEGVAREATISAACE
jgi:hypothetical protein